MNRINYANTNSLWSSVLVETLYRCGLKYAVISPGSRSTPLTVAFAGHSEISAIPVLDERSAGFFALGLAKQTHQPVGLVCTSGTAAANYFPAIIEASEARIPLLILTADRPPELRDCGAGQAINQIRLYGDYPVYQGEMAIPVTAVAALESMRSDIVHAFGESGFGPVHLNCPFRDPLPPIEDGSTSEMPKIEESFFSKIQLSQRVSRVPESRIKLTTDRGLIICGTEFPENPAEYCAQVARLSDLSGWPVLADGLSPVRNFARLQSHLITAYDLLLRIKSFREAMEPETVIALGPLPTSKELRAWLTNAECELYHVNRTGKHLDPTDSVVEVLDVEVADLCNCFDFSPLESKTYAEDWSVAEAGARGALDESFNDSSAKEFEGQVAWSLPGWLAEKTPVFVANSMPVRDIEYFLPPNDRQLQIIASRGANGIDGTLSTALGLAHKNQASVLLTGDLAFLHDSNGLLIRPQFEGHLTVILINNRGGGIFNHLPIAEFEPPFEAFFATPQQVDFKQLVESAGGSYAKAKSLKELPAFLGDLSVPGIRVIEVETNRNQDSEYRKSLFRIISNYL